MKVVMDKVDKVDVVLICHKLYDPVDPHTMKLLNVLAQYLGDGLMERAIIVFTFGDKYRVRVDQGQDAKEEMMKTQRE